MYITKNEVLTYIAENDVKFIKLLYIDINGVTKSISVQPPMLKKAFDDGVAFDNFVVKGFDTPGRKDLVIYPDPSTLSVLPWRPQHGRVARIYCNARFCDGSAYDGDSRYILKSVTDKAKNDGYTIQVGTDCEFYLFRLDEKGLPSKIPQDYAGYCDLAPLDKGENVRRDIILTLEQMGIVPVFSYHESGPGQNEIDFEPADAVVAADNFSTFKMAVRTVAAQDGLFASFMPKPMENQPGSGLHINMALYKNGVNQFETETEDARAFVSGVMSHMAEMTAFLNPMNQSYSRFGSFEAPSYINYSRNNDGSLIRLREGEDGNIGLSLWSPDSSCNQYLAIALVIAAGLEGIRNKLELPEINHKSAQKLPSSLQEALVLAENSEFIKSVIPSSLLQQFVDYKRNAGDPEFGDL